MITDSICYSRYSPNLLASLSRPTSSDQLKMKWTAGVKFGPGGSVVVLAVILGMSTLDLSTLLDSTKCHRIVLIDGNYTKLIQMPNTTRSCLNYSANLPPLSNVTCVLSFNTSENNNNTYVQTGVWLLKTNNIYELKITRGKTRPRVPICFVSGKCNSSWPQWIEDWTRHPVSPNEECTIICLNPNSTCDNAKYKPCNDTTSNEDIIEFINQSSYCSKCGSPVQKPEVQITLPKVEFSGGSADKTDKAEVMKNLTSSVLELMGNKTTASVTVGDVQGVFVKPEDPKKPEPASFIYSEVTNLSIIQDTTQTQKYPRAVSVPKEAFEKAANQSKTALFTAVFRFPEFPKDEKNSTVLNNEVYSIDMGAEIANLTDTINLTFRNVKRSGFTLHCHSWDGEGAKPNWTTEGCFTIETDDGVTCGCVHLTFFALLMAADPTETISGTDLSNLTYITSIGCGLSIFFLGVALFMHFLLRRSRQSDSVHILINLFVALVLLNLTFLTNEYVANTGNLIGCKLMAGFMHYCLLTSFTWFGLEALHLCLQLGRNSTPIKHYLTKICIAGWALPAVVVTVVFCLQKYNQLVIHADDGKDVKMCWITDSAVHYVVNIGYYSIIFAFTLTTFVVMLRWIFLLKGTAVNRHKPPAASGKRTTTGTSDALTVMGLCCTLGLTWGFAFFAYGALRLPSYYIFTILNSFQGFFLFIYYYKTSKFVGDQMTSEKTTSTATEATSMENPYEKPKAF
ncbi:adhesion G-protein coupled receptor G2-like [Colossoma macropomum]|uniref:adhesion G-protein coupled receptor G2-like n=1 Tax=Colossoma macropomum TaxID=42526 RepID=UPI001863EDBA|nr:adhesion G-protein coupled receptor G2-like [Colossoma macropomum]